MAKSLQYYKRGGCMFYFTTHNNTMFIMIIGNTLKKNSLESGPFGFRIRL